MKNWKKVKLGSLLTESKIVSDNPDTNRRLRVRLNMLGIEKRPNTNDQEGATKYYIRRAGQFIYGKQNLHKGAFGIIPEELDGFESSSDIPAFDVDESCYPEWIYYFFKKGNFYAKLEGLAKGIGSKRIQPKQIYELNINLPPKQEQEKILAEIKNTEIVNQKLLTELELQENKLVLLRQSILQEAIEGKLTELWREKNKREGSVQELLNRIRKENECYRTKHKIKNYQSLLSTTINDTPYEIPKNWSWCKLEEIIREKPRNGYSPREAGYQTDTKSLKLGATTKGYFDPSEIKYIDETIPKDSHLWLKDGDILIQRSNSIDYVGVSAIYRGESFDFIYPDLMMKITCSISSMTEYLHIVLSAPSTRDYFRKNATGTSGTMPKINQDILIQTLVPICSLEEQQEIVRQVNHLFSVCDNLSHENRVNKENADNYFQSALIKLLGKESANFSVKDFSARNSISPTRLVKYSNKTTFMELVDLLKKHGELHAEDLWKMSKHFDNKNIGDSIDKFYADLKEKIEVDNAIKEVINKKGYLELV